MVNCTRFYNSWQGVQQQQPVASVVWRQLHPLYRKAPFAECMYAVAVNGGSKWRIDGQLKSLSPPFSCETTSCPIKSDALQEDNATGIFRRVLMIWAVNSCFCSFGVGHAAKLLATVSDVTWLLFFLQTVRRCTRIRQAIFLRAVKLCAVVLFGVPHGIGWLNTHGLGR